MNDNLKDLVNHLNEFTGATACYIGKVVKPIKQDIKDHEYEDAHENSINEDSKEKIVEDWSSRISLRNLRKEEMSSLKFFF